MSLNNKVAIVTGGGRGIGKAISLALGKSGAALAITYCENKSAADETAKEVIAFGSSAEVIQMEVRNRKSIRNAILAAVKRYGGIDILVNNAGINKPADFDQITDEDWDNILNVNLKGPFICAQEIIPFLRKRGGGSIVNISSFSGQLGGPRTAHYAASKAGLISLGQVIARFGAKDNIRCNNVSAGLIASEMAADGMKAGIVNKMAENILLGKIGTPEDVAEAVVFLASESSRYITAQTINVNGGLYF